MKLPNEAPGLGKASIHANATLLCLLVSCPAQWQSLWLHSQMLHLLSDLVSHPGYSRLPLINQQLIKRLVSSCSSEGNRAPWVLQPAQPRAGLDHRPCSWSSAASCHRLGELVRLWLSYRLLQASPSTPTDPAPSSVSSFPPSCGQTPPISFCPSLPIKGRMLHPTPCRSVGKGTSGSPGGSVCPGTEGPWGSPQLLGACSSGSTAAVVAHVWASAMQQ